MNKLLPHKDFEEIYPYIKVAFRIFLCTPISNCSVERSVSVLRKIKNYLQSVMTEKRLNSLAILTIQSEITRMLECDDIIVSYASNNVRRKALSFS